MNKLIEFITYLIKCSMAMGLTLVIIFILDKIGYDTKDYIILLLFLNCVSSFTYTQKRINK